MSEAQTYCGFRAGGLSFAAAVESIDEILRAGAMTEVPGAADFILGLMNLRGQVLTVIDLGALLSRPGRQGAGGFIIVARIFGEPYGLFIDRIGDIERAAATIRPAAPVLGAELAGLVTGAYSRGDEAVLILDFDRCLERARQRVGEIGEAHQRGLSSR